MFIRLIASIFRTPGRRWPGVVVGLVGGGLLVGTLYAGTPVEAARPAVTVAARSPSAPAAADLASLEVRVNRLKGAWSDLAAYYDGEVAPIERVLLQYRNDPVLAERIAVALVRESNRVGLEPRLLLAVLLVENPWLDPTARSSVGAVGLMQVMPVHRGAWAECGADLEDIDSNICHGAHIFAHYFSGSNGDVDRALLRYNGCVRGTNTPNCQQYPSRVFARAGRASVLAWVGAPVPAMP